MWRYNYEAACLCHSFKGTTWKKHKYIAIKNGRYIYPNKLTYSKDKLENDPLGINGEIEERKTGLANQPYAEINIHKSANDFRAHNTLNEYNRYRRYGLNHDMAKSILPKTNEYTSPRYEDAKSEEERRAIFENDVKIHNEGTKRKEIEDRKKRLSKVGTNKKGWTVRRAKRLGAEVSENQKEWREYTRKKNADKRRKESVERAKRLGAEVSSKDSGSSSKPKETFKSRSNRAKRRAKRAWDKFSNMPFKRKK